MKIKNIAIFGAGDQAKIVANEIKNYKNYRIRFFITNDIKKKIKGILNYDVISLKEAIKKQEEFQYGIIAVGDINLKIKIFNKAKNYLKKIKWLKIISKYSNIDKSVKIGEGSFIMNGVTINLNAKIGKHCLINTSSIIEHDCKINNFVNCSPKTLLLGNVTVNSNSYIGANSTIIENIRIGKNVIIGANSLVNKNCLDNYLYFGNPIKKIRKI